MTVDEKYMRRAITLSRKGLMMVSPNPMVGCVIVDRDGKIIGEGYHRQIGGPHAEVNAINSVKDPEALKDCTLYVNLEPCAHQGRTPSCAQLIIDKKIPRVVVGCRDPFPAVNGKGIEMLREAGVEVEVGVLEDLCIQQNAMFLTAHNEKRPYIFLKWAQSRDGYLDVKREPNEEHAMISNPLTAALTHRVRGTMDGIMVGSGTVLADNPHLDNRLWVGRSPRPIILDRRGRVPKDAWIMQRDPIIYREDMPLIDILHDLYDRGMITVMVEGGAQLFKSLIDANLWDFARIEIAPVDFGEFGTVKAPEITGKLFNTFNLEGNNIQYIANNPLVNREELI